MARGSSDATATLHQSQQNSNSLMGNANGIYGDIVPTLESTMANPQGFSPADESAMETEGLQSAGGSQAGAVGEGGLLAARTKNSGAAARAISDSSRVAGETLSKNLLGIRTENAKLKQHQRDQAQSGLENTLGLETQAGNTALGQVAPLINANTDAINASWDGMKYIGDPLIAAAGGAGAAAAGKPCWIAEVIYGVDDARTHAIRAYLRGPFRDSVMGSAIVTVYLAIGRPAAWAARRSLWLRAALKPMFDKALKSAMRERD